MTPKFVHFPGLVPVVDRESALRAIDEITKQGEGTRRDREDCHFGAFVGMLKELLESRDRGLTFSPAQPALRNPAARIEPGIFVHFSLFTKSADFCNRHTKTEVT